MKDSDSYKCYVLRKLRVGVNLLSRPSQDSVCISVVLPTRSDCITITSSEISHHSADLSTNLTTFEVGNGFDHRNGSHLFSTRTNPAILSAAASCRRLRRRRPGNCETRKARTIRIRTTWRG